MNEELVFLTFEEFGQIANGYAQNIDRAQFDAALLSVMQVFFRELIGKDRYIDLIANPNSTENIELINGSAPTYYGAKKWLIYQVLLRLAMQTNINFTRSGVVQKDSEASVLPSAGEKMMLIENISTLCDVYQRGILEYLGSCNVNTQFYTKRIVVQGGANKFPI